MSGSREDTEKITSLRSHDPLPHSAVPSSVLCNVIITTPKYTQYTFWFVVENVDLGNNFISDIWLN